MKSITSFAYDAKVSRARDSRACCASPGNTARRLSAMAARVPAISRHAIQVPARPMPYDTRRGRTLTPRYVALKIAPLFRPCRVQRRRIRSRRLVGAPGISRSSEAFKESIVHRQKARTGRVRNRPQFALLARIDGRHGRGLDTAPAAANLDEHFGFYLVLGGVQPQRPERVDAKHTEAALRVVERHADKPRQHPAADAIGVIARRGHPVAFEPALPQDHVGAASDGAV